MTVRQTKDTISPEIQRIQRELAALPAKAYVEWQKNTPVRTGNARRNTKLSSKTIEAKYPYAQRLDEGYSKKAPKGMSQPTEKFVEQEIKKIMGK